ncbi:hypothetical protein ANN_04278 [Periplaneta americana]|uniref:DUF4817 domain-containing protein n=1 Tax=Periplaneta americana TaxID=6978 RepID=A0ABQ8T851_PERAM|nr:hypothetical protein ANN_04278 [Periplaneta americana]
MATAQERAQAIWWYAETYSVIQVQRNFRRVFQKEPPSRNTIKTSVRQAYERSPRKSVRQAGRELQMPKSTVHTILHRSLGFHAYKLQLVHELKPDDGNKRQAFAIDMLQHIDEDPAFLTRIAFSDEATFHLSGKVNIHNGPTRWPPRSPDITPLDFFLWGYVKNEVYTGHKIRDLQQLCGRIRDAVTLEMLQKTWQEIEFRLDVLRATRGSHVEVYCFLIKLVHIKSTTLPCEAILDYEFITATQRAYQREFGVRNPPKRNTILGLTVNTAEYRLIFIEFVEQLDDVELSQGYFQQDGATCHTSNESMELIASFFDDRIISRNLWPPRSPDLITPNFFLWGYLKDRVYATRPQTLDDMKHNITQEIQAIDNRVLQRVASNMERRVELCLMQDEGHFQHLL